MVANATGYGFLCPFLSHLGRSSPSVTSPCEHAGIFMDWSTGAFIPSPCKKWLMSLYGSHASGAYFPFLNSTKYRITISQHTQHLRVHELTHALGFFKNRNVKFYVPTSRCSNGKNVTTPIGTIRGRSMPVSWNSDFCKTLYRKSGYYPSTSANSVPAVYYIVSVCISTLMIFFCTFLTKSSNIGRLNRRT